MKGLSLNGISTAKKNIAALLILLAAGAWFSLDYLNKQELGSAEQMRESMMSARIEAKKRAAEDSKRQAEEKIRFEQKLLSNLAICQDAALKAQSDYIGIIQKISPKKRGLAVLPQSVTNEAEQILESAKAECQIIYDTQLKAGK